MKAVFSPHAAERLGEHIEVELVDESGTRRRRAKLPARAEVGELMGVLVTKLGLPLFDPAGQPLTYHLDHKRTGSRLAERDTLAGAGVDAGDVLRLSAEITAG